MLLFLLWPFCQGQVRLSSEMLPTGADLFYTLCAFTDAQPALSVLKMY